MVFMCGSALCCGSAHEKKNQNQTSDANLNTIGTSILTGNRPSNYGSAYWAYAKFTTGDRVHGSANEKLSVRNTATDKVLNVKKQIIKVHSIVNYSNKGHGSAKLTTGGRVHGSASEKLSAQCKATDKDTNVYKHNITVNSIVKYCNREHGSTYEKIAVKIIFNGNNISIAFLVYGIKMNVLSIVILVNSTSNSETLLSLDDPLADSEPESICDVEDVATQQRLLEEGLDDCGGQSAEGERPRETANIDVAAKVPDINSEPSASCSQADKRIVATKPQELAEMGPSANCSKADKNTVPSGCPPPVGLATGEQEKLDKKRAEKSKKRVEKMDTSGPRTTHTGGGKEHRDHWATRLRTQPTSTNMAH